jgi:Tol biopolymer transport system component
MKHPFLSLVLYFIVFTGFSQRLSDKSTRTISFTTDEGTNMSVDVSPDGKTLVFDLLGSLYTVPITGGRAIPLINSTDWVRSPKFSPDGTQVAFISDRGNINNLWVIDLKSKKPGN